METNIKKAVAGIMVTAFLVGCNSFGLAAAGELTFVAMPVQYVAVKGDVAKFRAVNWMNDGYTGGIKDMAIDSKMGKDATVSFEGHAMSDRDMGAHLLISRNNGGYLQMDYGTFRKWYDNTGGSYPIYSHYPVTSLENSDLHLDIGHFALEGGAGSVDDSPFSIGYERDTKNGIKSRLSWASVYDNTVTGLSNVQKKIAPSWESMDEATDTLTVKAKAHAFGVTFKDEGKYEFFDGSLGREYKTISLTSGSQQNFVRQNNEPQTKMLSNVLRGERWSIDDKTYVAVGYRFAHDNNSEIINLRTYTPTNVITGTTFKDGYARTFQDTHTWTGELMSSLRDDLKFTAKAKAEVISRNSSADYLSDSTNPPDGIWNTIDADTIENKIIRTGQTVSLAYQGIPKTSVYTEVDMGQERNWLSEYRNQRGFQGTTPTSVGREEIANNPSFTETVGFRYVPTKTVNLTTDYKHIFQGQKFNTLSKTSAVALNQNSFFNKMLTDTDQIASRISWKPWKWLENALRFKDAQKKYHTQAVGQDWEKSQGSQRDYDYTITLIPTDAVMLNVGYMLQNLKASTPAAAFPDISTTSVGIPVFTANVYTWMMGASYAPLDNLSVFNSVEFSRAKNANYYYGSSSSFRYGVDDQWWDMNFGIRWSPKKDITIEPHYAYYSFLANQSIETGNYSAHVFWLDLKYAW